MPYQYLGQVAVPKRFVLLRHEAGHAICLKATTKIALYVNDPKMMAGVVFYLAGDLTFFESDTAVQPDNPHPIAHTDIAKCMQNRTFKMLGMMPEKFKEHLSAAITKSVTMKPARKKHFLERL